MVARAKGLGVVLSECRRTHRGVNRAAVFDRSFNPIHQVIMQPLIVCIAGPAIAVSVTGS